MQGSQKSNLACRSGGKSCKVYLQRGQKLFADYFINQFCTKFLDVHNSESSSYILMLWGSYDSSFNMLSNEPHNMQIHCQVSEI